MLLKIFLNSILLFIAKIIFNPLLPPPVPSRSLFELPFEFEAEEEAVINAEECFELPPIQHIDLDIPIQAKPESPTSKQNKLLMEQSRRIEVFDRINEMEYEDSILYRSGANRRHKKDPSCSKGHSSKKKKAKSGIVEIGQAMDETPSSSSSCDKTSGESNKKSNMKLEVTTRPLQMDASFCTDTWYVYSSTIYCEFLFIFYAFLLFVSGITNTHLFTL